MYLSVIIPAHNEERNIRNTVISINKYLEGRGFEYEIITVVNGSTDKTAEIMNELTPSNSHFKLIVLKEAGKGGAVIKGMLEAKGEYRLFTDADNSTSIDHIEKMMPYFEKGYGMVIGSIAVKGHKVAQGSEPAWRRIAGKLGNLFIQILVVPGIRDTQRGFKIMKAEAAEKIFPKITIKGWGFDVELLALARKYGYKIKEVPVDWHNDPHSHVGAKVYKEVLFETIKIRWNLIKGRYDNL